MFSWLSMVSLWVMIPNIQLCTVLNHGSAFFVVSEITSYNINVRISIRYKVNLTWSGRFDLGPMLRQQLAACNPDTWGQERLQNRKVKGAGGAHVELSPYVSICPNLTQWNKHIFWLMLTLSNLEVYPNNQPQKQPMHSQVCHRLRRDPGIARTCSKSNSPKRNEQHSFIWKQYVYISIYIYIYYRYIL